MSVSGAWAWESRCLCRGGLWVRRAGDDHALEITTAQPLEVDENIEILLTKPAVDGHGAKCVLAPVAEEDTSRLHLSAQRCFVSDAAEIGDRRHIGRLTACEDLRALAWLPASLGDAEDLTPIDPPDRSGVRMHDPTTPSQDKVRRCTAPVDLTEGHGLASHDVTVASDAAGRIWPGSPMEKQEAFDGWFEGPDCPAWAITVSFTAIKPDEVLLVGQQPRLEPVQRGGQDCLRCHAFGERISPRRGSQGRGVRDR